MIRIRDVQLQAPHSGSDPLLALGSMDIRNGEYVSVVGRNGAGKSLFLMMISGLRMPSAGGITFENANGSTPRRGLLFQNPGDQLLGSTVERDLAFGLENEGVPPEEIRRRVDEALAEGGITALARRPPHMLSEGEKQRVALASLLIQRPEVLLVDEPTARLDPDDRREFLARLAERHRGGTTILHVTHRMEELARADRVVGLDRGRVIFDGSPSEFGEEAAAACGMLDDSWRRAPSAPSPAAAPGTRPEGLCPLVELRDVRWSSDDGAGESRPVLCGVALEVFPGERVGLTGRSGSGKTTLAAILAGLLPPDAGTVERPARGRRGARRMERVGVALAFQEPERGFFEETVERDVAFGPSNLGLAEGPARERARVALGRVGLDPAAFGPRSPETLSGGEARRAGIAGLLALDTDLVVLDEPTTGLDADGVSRLREVLDGLRRDEVALVLVSHEIGLLRAECDRILRLEDGRLFPYAGS